MNMFFKRVKAGTIKQEVTAALYKCRYCPRNLQTPQGRASHESYRTDDEKLTTRPKRGSVKIVDQHVPLPPITSPFPTKKRQRKEKWKPTSKKLTQKEIFAKMLAGRERRLLEKAEEQAKANQIDVGEMEVVEQTIRNAPMTRHFNNAEKIMILDYYAKCKSGNGTARWVKKQFNRPTFSTAALRRMRLKETEIRAAPKKKKHAEKSGGRGEYPEMENELAHWIRATRAYGIPVEKYMLAVEGRRILNELHGPNTFKFSKVQ